MQVDRSVLISVSCWYRLVAPENVPLRVSLAPGVVSGVSLVDVFVLMLLGFAYSMYPERFTVFELCMYQTSKQITCILKP